MILLQSKQGLAVTVGANEVGTARKHAPQPQAYGPGHRLRVYRAPVDLAGLQLHHAVGVAQRPEIVVCHGYPQRIAHAVSAAPYALVVAINHIPCVAHKVKFLAATYYATVVIRYVIGGNPLVARMLSYQPALLIHKIVGHLCGITSVIEYLVRVHKLLPCLRERYLFE